MVGIAIQVDQALIGSVFIVFVLLTLLAILLFKNTRSEPSLSLRLTRLFIRQKIMVSLGRPGNQDGNVFIAIFGAIAMVGILGASVMTFMKGPLATSVKLTKMNAAENQMAIGAQVAVMATASQANNGD